jgi:hypothetical protein
MSPEERSLQRHLRDGPFQLGVDRGDWRKISLEYPRGIFAVRTAPRAGAPDELALLFDLTGYPQIPTAQPWDVHASAPLPIDLWPIGERASMAFNPNWNSHDRALYIPCDRKALEGHEPWIAQYPAYLWDPKRGIVRYLEVVGEILHSSGYTGVQRQAA